MANAFAIVIGGAILLAVPVLAGIIDWQIRSFQYEAFGHLRKAARNLRLLSAAMLLFYVAVIATNAATRGLWALFDEPFSPESLGTYTRVVAVIVGYLFAVAVAKELYLITQPGARADLDEGQNRRIRQS